MKSNPFILKEENDDKSV